MMHPPAALAILIAAAVLVASHVKGDDTSNWKPKYGNPSKPTNGRNSTEWPQYAGPSQRTRSGCRPKKNFIFMVSDGFGTSSQTLAREYMEFLKLGDEQKVRDDLEFAMPLDGLLAGAVRTKSFDSFVTDSSASATAYSCGLKTLNLGVGVDPKDVACVTALEAAKAAGYTTALIVTSRVTHATPASWSSHHVNRDAEDSIAVQQVGDNVLGRQVDLMIGGGRSFFLPQSAKGSKRKDDRNLIKEATEKFGWKTFIETRDQFMALPNSGKSLPLLGLFADGHMDFEIDRDATKQPSLTEMVQKGLAILATATSENCDSPGFFVMIEGSRIDHSAHLNDIATHLHDIIEYNKAISIVRSFTQRPEHVKVTAALSVSDHETGGVSKGAQFDLMRTDPWPRDYAWIPSAVTPVKMSVEVLGPIIAAYSGNDLPGFIRATVKDKFGYDLTQDEVDTLCRAYDANKKNLYPGTFQIEWELSRLISKRALVGFTTHGHTGTDVNLYSVNAPASAPLHGNMDNTHLATYTWKFLGVEDQISRLKSKIARQPTGKEQSAQERLQRRRANANRNAFGHSGVLRND